MSFENLICLRANRLAPLNGQIKGHEQILFRDFQSKIQSNYVCISAVNLAAKNAFTLLIAHMSESSWKKKLFETMLQTRSMIKICASWRNGEFDTNNYCIKMIQWDRKKASKYSHRERERAQ